MLHVILVMRLKFNPILLVVLLWLCSIKSFASDYRSVEDNYSNLAVVDCNKFLNIRSKPSIDSSVIGIIQTGGACDVLAEDKTWCFITSGGITGYVKREYLLFGDEALERANILATKKILLNEEVKVYSKKSTESKVWLTPVRNTVYEVLSEDSDWYEVDITGTSGYIQTCCDVSRFCGLPEATKTYGVLQTGDRAELVKYAMKFLGNKYVWGGDDPNTGADCSGFVRYVYKEIRPDIWLPRVSYQQCYVGDKVSSLNMKPGDLLFYAYNDGTVHHVAMYIGNGMIIHAASRTQGIILSSWNYQVPKYIRNVLGD